MGNSHGSGKNCHQATKLAALANRPTRIQFIRARQANGAGGRPIREVTPQDPNLDPVLVLDELLVDSGHANAAITALGNEYVRAPSDPSGLGGTLTRLVPSPSRQQSPEAAVRQLTTNAGLRASVNHVVTLGGTDKGGVTPDDADTGIGTGTTSLNGPLVVVIDTGLDAAASNRSDRWLDGVSPVDAQRDIDTLRPLDPNGQPIPGKLDLGAGHGTFVAGVIRQVAQHSNIKVIRALAPDGTGSELELADAILRAADEFRTVPGRKGILNLSLGFETFDGQEPTTISAAIAALPEDVIVVAAAGNAPSGIKLWPAAIDGVVAVGSHKGDGDDNTAPTVSPWSNLGIWVKASARGECVVSTFVEGTEMSPPPGPTAVLYDPTPDTFPLHNPVAIWTGTSFSTPQVAGAMARAWQNSSLTKPEVLNSVLSSQHETTTHGVLLDIL